MGDSWNIIAHASVCVRGGVGRVGIAMGASLPPFATKSKIKTKSVQKKEGKGTSQR